MALHSSLLVLSVTGRRWIIVNKCLILTFETNRTSFPILPGNMLTVSAKKRAFIRPESRVVDLEVHWDVCSNASLPSSGTDPFNPAPGDGWEDEFNN